MFVLDFVCCAFGSRITHVARGQATDAEQYTALPACDAFAPCCRLGEWTHLYCGRQELYGRGDFDSGHFLRCVDPHIFSLHPSAHSDLRFANT